MSLPVLGASTLASRPWPRGSILTEVVRVAEVEGVTAVNVMVQRLFDQVLWLVACKLCHSVEEWRLHESSGSSAPSFKRVLALPTNQV